MAAIKKNPVFLLFAVLTLFVVGSLTAFFTTTYFTDDYQFTRFADRLFKEEVASNTLTLHYTLANPASYGIHNYPLTLGSLSQETITENKLYTQTLLEKLKTFNPESLSLKNQILYDTLLLLLDTEKNLNNYPLLYEPLSPTLGIQAQLPILLAEYTFRTKKDIDDYLSLLENIYPYYEELLAYENDKSSAGLFMCESTALGVIQQCSDFISQKEQHFLITTFEEKIDSCDFLSDRQKDKYKETNQLLLETSCFPAYELLIDRLTKIKDTGTNAGGLAHFPNGADYYTYHVRSETGIYDSIETIEKRLYQQFYNDYMQIQRLCTVYPNITKDVEAYTGTLTDFTNPESMLTHLQSQMTYNFPEISTVDYEIKYVNDSLKEHLSPAFYLTPPIDTLTPNAIYLNPESKLTGTTLYSTLAHEGFPGHLYQTQYFAQMDVHPLRTLLANDGYVEGWATYIEKYAYHYAPIPYEVSEYLTYNRSLSLCLYSLLDIGIHYHGWSLDRVGKLLTAVGITETTSWQEIYQCLLEDPANYLKYCLGSIYLQDLGAQQAEALGNDFDLLSFHKKILEIGPVPFPVLSKYLSYDF